MRLTPVLAERILADIPAMGVSEACRRQGVHRATWYRHAARMAPHDCQCGAHADPESEILKLARSHPHWGCDRIAYCLEVCGLRISSPTVQRILIRHGLGRRKEREAATRALSPNGPSLLA